jgi:hypothetical protein
MIADEIKLITNILLVEIREIQLHTWGFLRKEETVDSLSCVAHLWLPLGISILL